MKVTDTLFDGLKLIEPEIRVDSRGSLTRLYCKKEFSSFFNKEFVQENLSITKAKGTFRGFHYQVPPYGETKLVRCIKGKVIDFAVDLRKNSKTFLKTFTVELNEEKMNMILIPEGFAHGFQALTDNCMLLYLHTNFYNPQNERGVRYNDSKIKISLPVPVSDISERDENHPYLNNEFDGLTFEM